MPITTPWETVTPTIGAGSIGNGTLVARTRRVDGNFFFALRLSFGSTTQFSVTPGEYFQLNTPPLTAGPGITETAAPVLARGGSLTSLAAGSALVLLNDAEGEAYTNVRIYPVFGTDELDATHPFTWATGHSLMIGNAMEAFDN